MTQAQMADASGLQVVANEEGKYIVLNQAGLEVAPIEQQQTGSSTLPQQAFGRDEKIWHQSAPDSTLPETVDNGRINVKKRIWRTRNRKLFWSSMLIGTLVIIALAIGLGVGISQRQRSGNNSSPEDLGPAPPASSNSATSSVPASTAISPSMTALPRSARQDTGVMAFYPATEDDIVWLYWQDRTNDIRSLTYSYGGTWQNSARLPIDDALNGTALAGTWWFAQDGQSGPQTYNIIYADNKGVLQNLVATADNMTWAKGSLGTYSFKVPTDRRVGMSMCAHFDLFGAMSGGLLLMAGGEDGLVHEYLYAFDNQTWIRGNVFPGTNGYAAAEPYVGENETIYMLTVTNAPTPELEFWWRTFQKIPSWQASPWTKGADSLGSVMANTSAALAGDISTTFYIDGNMELASMNTTGTDVGRRWAGSNKTNVKVQSNSQLAFLYVTDPKADQNPTTQGIHIFTQTNATNLVHIKGYVGNMTIVEDVPILA